MARLSGPADLASRLRLQPTEDQSKLMTRFMEGGRVLHSVMSPELTRASAVCMLYRMLTKDGSRGLVLASNQQMAREFMGFLRVISESDPAINSVCRWTRWSTLKISDSCGYECRVLQNISGGARGLKDDSMTTVVVLGAGMSDNHAFVENYTALDRTLRGEDTKFICLW